MTAKARFRLKGEQRITFTVQARNQSNVLLPVVSLFQELNVGIDAIYMIRRKSAENVRINVTVRLDRQRAVKIEAHLTNIAGVLSVKTEMDTKAVLPDSLSDKPGPRLDP